MTSIIISRKFLVFTCFSFLGAMTSQTSVYGFNILLDVSSPVNNNGEFIYTYNVTLESGESLTPNSFNDLILTSLAEVTDAQAVSPYAVPANGFDSTSANFDVVSDPSPATSFPGAIEITSTSSIVGNVDYLAFYNDSNNLPASLSGQVQGPIESNSIPFTFSPGLGLLISASFFSVYYLRRKNYASVSE